MSKALRILLWILIISLLIVPIAALTCKIFGFVLELKMPMLFSTIPSIVSIALLILCIHVDRKANGEPLYCILGPLSVFHGLSYIRHNTWVFLPVVITTVVCIFIMFYYAPSGWKKWLSACLGVIMSIALLLMAAINLIIFGSYVPYKLSKTVPSPYNDQYAKVQLVNGEPFSDYTRIDVCYYDSIDTPFYRIYQAPLAVYSCDDEEYWTIDIQWKNENTLVINSTDYPIP